LQGGQTGDARKRLQVEPKTSQAVNVLQWKPMNFKST